MRVGMAGCWVCCVGLPSIKVWWIHCETHENGRVIMCGAVGAMTAITASPAAPLTALVARRPQQMEPAGEGQAQADRERERER